MKQQIGMTGRVFRRRVPALIDWYDRQRKRCTKCGRRRFRKFFGQNSARPDGLHAWCRDCKAAAARAARARSKREIEQLRRAVGTTPITRQRHDVEWH
jgi:hypothetical protein